MPKEIVESRFFLQIDDSIAAPPGAVEAYFEAKRWSLGIPTTDELYAGASLFPGEWDGSKGHFVQKIMYRRVGERNRI